MTQTMTDSQNHCRSDAALGDAARMLLFDVCEPGNGYSDWDIPNAVWEQLGVEFEAFLSEPQNDADMKYIEVGYERAATWWIGDRNGEGIGFQDHYPGVCPEAYKENDAAHRLFKSALSMGPVEMYAGDDNNLYLTSQLPESWEPLLEAAREKYVYSN